jgi:hypothetical protein
MSISTDGSINKDPNSSTNQVIVTPDIDGGTADSLVIGATTPAAAAFTTVTTTGTLDLTITDIAAAGDKGINLNITEGSTALTGTLHGMFIRATNGSTNAAGTGVIRGIEAGARNTAGGGTCAVLTGGYFSADPKDVEGTTLRAIEAVLAGSDGGTSTLAVGIEIFNNSASVQTTSYAIDINEGSEAGRKVFTKDIRLQHGETIDNTVDGVVSISGGLRAPLAEDIEPSTDSLSINQCNGGVINNYGQANDAVLTLPAAAEGYNFTVILGTTVAKYYRILPLGTANDSIYLDGATTGDDKYVQIASAVAGACIQFFTFQTGASPDYDWYAATVSGAWVAEA